MSSRHPRAVALGRLAGRDDPPRRHPRSGGAPATLALPSVMGHPLAPCECPLLHVGSTRRHGVRSARDRGGAHLFARLGLRAASMHRRTRAMLQSAPAPDLDAVPWLLLQAKSTTGPGVFDRVTFVQRVRTGGGKAPTTGCDAADIGREARVPYTADYFFYRGTP